MADQNQEVVDELDEQAKALNIEDDGKTNFDSNIDSDDDQPAPAKAPEEAPSDEDEEETDSPPPEKPPRETKAPLRRIKQAEKQKSKIEAMEERLSAKFTEQIGELAKAIATAKTPEAKVEAKDEMDQFFEDNGIEESSRALYRNFAKAILKDKPVVTAEKTVETKPVVVEKPALPKEVPADDPSEKALFSKEWGEFEETFVEQFPDASYAQVIRAKQKMFDISHTPENASKTLTEILEENQTEFKDALFKPKNRRSAERGIRSTDHDTSPTTTDEDKDIETVEDALAAEAELNSAVEAQPQFIHRGNQKIKLR